MAQWAALESSTPADHSHSAQRPGPHKQATLATPVGAIQSEKIKLKSNAVIVVEMAAVIVVGMVGGRRGRRVVAAAYGP